MKSQKSLLVVIFAVFIGLVAGLVLAANLDWTMKSIAADNNVESMIKPVVLGSQEEDSDEFIGLERLSKAFADVAKKVMPSVVTINSEKVVKTRRHPFMDDEFFRYWFRMPDQQQDQIRRGLGSGVIVNPDGYILTNNHVVSEADEITVTINKQEYDAEIVGTDPESDIAVIKIDASDLTPIKLGDSDKLLVGEWVLAIGNPFDQLLQQTVTAGIVSAKGRSGLMQGQITYEDFIQTDAAINPGNSGGALVNLQGELIGINTAILGQANVGIGFAIPISLAKNVMEQLISDGRVVRGYLGLLPRPVDEEYAQAFGLETAKGALVDQVVEDGPAEKAGIEAGDIILEMNGRDIADDDELRNLTAAFAPNTKVDLTVWRDGKKREITVELGERPQAGQAMVEPEESAENKLGIDVTNLTRELARRYDLEDESGVLVTDVQRNSVAFREGIRSGDLIVSVNRNDVTNVSEFNTIIADLDAGDVVLFRLKRDGRSTFAALRVPEKNE